MESLNIVLKEKKVKKHQMALKLMDQLKVRLPRERIRKRKIRRKSQMLLRISFTRILWTSKRRESSSLSGKNTDMATGERDQAKHLSLLRLKFLNNLKNFLSHQRRKFSTQNKQKLRTKSRKLQVNLKKRKPVSKKFCCKRMLK